MIQDGLIMLIYHGQDRICGLCQSCDFYLVSLLTTYVSENLLGIAKWNVRCWLTLAIIMFSLLHVTSLQALPF